MSVILFILRRSHFALLLIAGVLSPGAGAAVWQPPAAAPVAEPSLQGRTIRVGLPNPDGARGMLTGTRADPQGFLKELFEYIAQSEGLKIEFVAIEKDASKDITEELAKGTVDVFAGITVSDAALRRFRLSTPVIVTQGVAFTRVGTKPPTTLDDMRKLKVVVPVGGAGRAFGAEQGLQVTPKDRYKEAFDAVVSGEADAIVTTRLAGNYEIKKQGYTGLQVSVLEPVGFKRAYAYGVRPEDGPLLVAIETGLLAAQQDGRFRTLYEREIAQFQPVDSPQSVELQTVVRVASVVGGILAVLAGVWLWRSRERRRELVRVLAESEQRYRGIFDQSHDAVLMIDPDSSRVIEANSAAERMYGYGPGELTGVNVAEITTHAALITERTQRVLKEGALRVARSRHKGRDGRTIIADVHSATGTIGGKTVILTMVRDVTASSSYEELIRAVIEASPHVAIQGFDRDGRVHFWNEASTRLYGWTAEEAVGRSLADLIAPPDAYAEIVGVLSKIEAEHRPSGLMEFLMHSKSGEPRWVLSEIVPAPNPQGELRFVCVDIDVSELKLGERRLQDAQARLSSALEGAGAGTWSIDVKAQTIDPDRSLVRLVELDALRSGPRPISEVAERVNPEDLPGVLAALGVAMRGEGPYRAEYRVMLAGGGTRWLSSRGKLIRDAKGDVVTISGACVDVTETKLASADADRLRDELERARRLESLGLLAGGLAHDFNNLLVGIRGNTELALGVLAGDSPARRALELVVQATDRTADLTNQLLAAAGRSRLAPESIDLNAEVTSAVDLLRPRLGQRVTVEFDLAATAVVTRADGAQTRQALSNLLTNAADALGPEGGRIVVRTGVLSLTRQDFENDAYKVRASPGEFAFIEVADNGCGMDERVLARVFDPFYSTKASGRGLGLSLVMMTVRRHDGAILIDSTPGHGTRCRLLLPLVAAQPGGEPGPQSPLTRKPGRALIIDDEPMVRQVIGGMLRHEGWTTTDAVSGETGIGAAREQSFDVVFLDLTMPGMSGVDTAAALREAAPGLPIVFVSGYSRVMADTGGVLAGEVFVQKPFNAAELLAAADEAMRRL